jgi:hypothetical protein
MTRWACRVATILAVWALLLPSIIDLRPGA